MTGWRLIETAPQDSTEILVKDADDYVYVVAYCPPGQLPGYEWLDVVQANWIRRASGDWDLFDGAFIQSVDAIKWHPIPAERTYIQQFVGWLLGLLGEKAVAQ